MVKDLQASVETLSAAASKSSNRATMPLLPPLPFEMGQAQPMPMLLNNDGILAGTKPAAAYGRGTPTADGAHGSDTADWHVWRLWTQRKQPHAGASSGPTRARQPERESFQ
ncbi:hypothetical protein DL89DRAFT_254954 [Linderina pennispora]|uniref:Uncharacterized protein n=1 Tax=Linderina pennispora TaxID=61395 RepID=A0A1Y1WHF1_9FUNG|nr:uncharacterized protein DL89DRAFT_254954 [Linderina pennispora]ORX72768.1 hypothetical protein DL89DRAFT_254954 [Linderina pennispora]